MSVQVTNNENSKQYIASDRSTSNNNSIDNVQLETDGDRNIEV